MGIPLKWAGTVGSASVVGADMTEDEEAPDGGAAVTGGWFSSRTLPLARFTEMAFLADDVTIASFAAICFKA